MKYLKFCLLSSALVFSIVGPTARALELPGSSSSYQISLDEPSDLQSLLERELDRQRDSNIYLNELTQPNRIARYEANLLLERLQSEGYYDAEVDYHVEADSLIYQVVSGSQYLVSEILLKTPSHINLDSYAIDIKETDPVVAENILAAQQSINAYVTDNYCMLEVDTSYQVILENSTQRARVVFEVADSPAVNFGEIRFSGLSSIDDDFLMNLLPMKPGDCYKAALVNNARLNLVQSNLLLGVGADVGEPHDGKVDVTFGVTERAHRTLGAGLGFETDNGIGVSGSWEHRNLLGRAEQLVVDIALAQQIQGLTADFRISQFLRDDQNIVFYGDLIREDTDAYESKSLDAGAELTRFFGNHLRATLGGEIQLSRVQEDLNTDDFALLSVPFGLEYDRRNDPLNPTRGWVAVVKSQPYWDGYETSTRFLKSSVAGSLYHTFDEAPLSPTVALRGATGSIAGEARETIPANLRFYSGGGGSVRGYPFQSLGPLDTDGDPSGGLSFTEISVETRMKFNETWGAALFLDGGYAYENRTPELDEELLWGAGLGLRFYTSFAPIRVDIGVPLNKRDDVDDSFQLYIGLGQAF